MLGTPPAFILSQDQTLIKSVCLRQNKLTFIISCLFRYWPAKVNNFYCFLKVYKYCYLYAFVWIFKIVSLFSYQGSFISSLPLSNSDILSYGFAIVNNFFEFLFYKTNGETGIWTLAPLLTTYSLSRGAPSASWVFLQGLHINHIKRRRWDSNPRSLSGSPVCKTGSLNHSDTSPRLSCNCDS